jgi:hypothetical protein
MSERRPDFIVLAKHRDLVDRRKEVWIRRLVLAILAAIPVIALFNVFGQRPSTSTAATPAARLSVYTSGALRGGLLYEARFHVQAVRELKDARLVLDPGWLEGMQVNTIEPSPVGEASSNGRLSLDLGHVPAGQEHLLFMQFQVDPTNVGHRSRDVTLYDGARELLTVHRSVTIFP